MPKLSPESLEAMAGAPGLPPQIRRLAARIAASGTQQNPDDFPDPPSADDGGSFN
jgi:hypothetical protein